MTEKYQRKESHNYDHTHDHRSIKTNNIKLAAFLNFGFTVIEFIVGILTRSVSVSSNAIHDLGDSMVLFFSLLLENTSKKGRSKKYTYGYRRYALLGSLINTIILLVGGIIIVYNAVLRLFHPEDINGYIMFWFSLLGIVVNGLGALKLRKDSTTSQRGLYLNILSDFISWIGIFISSILVMFYNITIFDTLFSLMLGTWLVIQGAFLTRDIFYTLMQAVPKEIDIEEIDRIIRAQEGIVDVHDIHIWDLDGEDYISSFHIVIDSDNVDEVMSIKERLKVNLEEFGLNHSTIEIDNLANAVQNGELDRMFYEESISDQR